MVWEIVSSQQTQSKSDLSLILLLSRILIAIEEFVGTWVPKYTFPKVPEPISSFN